MNDIDGVSLAPHVAALVAVDPDAAFRQMCAALPPREPWQAFCACLIRVYMIRRGFHGADSWWPRTIEPPTPELVEAIEEAARCDIP